MCSKATSVWLDVSISVSADVEGREMQVLASCIWNEEVLGEREMCLAVDLGIPVPSL
ncbi:MAG: hypothetical protein NWE76_01005 [Candidatus Bathyarchaeota archaeon]|nr:hypothetical protein [Candidatus Bathyarchaeota archaeon]